MKTEKTPNNLLHIYDLKVHSNFDNFEIKTLNPTEDISFICYIR